MALLSGLTSGAMLGSAALNAGASMGLGSSGSSSSDGFGVSFGGGGSNSASSGWSDSSSYGYTNGWSDSEGWSDSWGNNYGESYGNTYGREASAMDYLFAERANEQAQEYWQEQAAYNSKEAAINRKWQEYMSNTAYQRAVADLKNAGLNPILAVGNMGASTPVGGAAQAGLASSAKANATADQRSGSYNYGSSGSSSYNYTKSRENGEQWSKSKSKNSSYGNSWENFASYNKSQAISNWNNNVRELTQNMISGVKNIVSAGGSAMKNAYSNWNSKGGNYSSKGWERDMMGNIVKQSK